MKNLHHLRYGRDTHIFHTVVDGGDFRCTAGSKYGVVVSGYLKIFRDSQLSFQCIFYLRRVHHLRQVHSQKKFLLRQAALRRRMLCGVLLVRQIKCFWKNQFHVWHKNSEILVLFSDHCNLVSDINKLGT